MELSSIIHYLNEAFHYKVDDHHYILKIITKKNDCTKVRIGFMEKYFREKNMPGIPSEVFYVDCKKVASAALPISPPSESISHTSCPFAEPPMHGLQGIFAIVSRESTKTAVFFPRRADARAASQPAWPAPTTITS